MSSADAEAGPARFGRIEIFLAERRLAVGGAPVALGSRAFDLLAALVARRDRIVPKDELIDAVWPGLVVEDNNLQVQISALRKVLGSQAIATVPGRGYRFTVAAGAPAEAAAGGARPAAEAEPSAPERRVPMAASAAAQGPARLLVADDNKVNRLLLCRSLALLGHEVTAVENGRLALEALRRERFELLLLDLEMPELDGFGVLEQRAADAALREVPVIVTSSLEGAAQVARCIELGADDYLHKPVNPVLLRARVEASLERKRLRDRERALLERLAPGLPAGASATHALQAGRRVEATLLAARLHGPAALGADRPADETLDLLNSWATLMCDAIEGHGGRVHRMAGDTLGAVFGASGASDGESESAAASALAAARAAGEMAEMLAQFNAERGAGARPPVTMAVGIAGGSVVAGFAGTARHAVYACVGAPVRAAEALAERAAGGGPAVLIDAATHAALAGRVASTAVAGAAFALGGG